VLSKDTTPTDGAGGKGSSNHAAASLEVWGFLLAVGCLFHNGTTGKWGLLSWDPVLSYSALWVILKPSALGRTRFLALVLLIDVLVEMPFIGNHKFLCGVWALMSLWAFGLGKSPGLANVSGVWPRLAPLIRMTALFMYLIAGLAKFNTAFLDPRLSAAVTYLVPLERWLPLPDGDWFKYCSIYGAIVIELSLGVLLAWPRTRLPGVFLAIGFHTLVGMMGHVTFSAFAPVLLLPFLPEGFSAWCLGVRDRALESQPWLGRAWYGLLFCFIAVWTAIVAAFSTELLSLQQVMYWLAAASPIPIIELLVYMTVLFGTVVAYVYRGTWRNARSAGRLRDTGYAGVALAVVMVANGLSPYLGFKTMYSFTMFSNIQTEGNQWNHLLIPKAVRVLGFQDDLVTILESSDHTLARAAERGERRVWFHFHQYVSECPDISVTYEHRGKRFEVERVGDHPVLSKRPNPLLGKVLYFRPVRLPEKNTGLLEQR